MELTLAVVTYRRPNELRRLLARVADQVARTGAVVLVVDNDPDGTAEAVCDEARSANVPLTYVREPRPGIVAARNTALRHAPTALVAFTDDDTSPSPQWLDELLAAHRTTGADVVTGPVRFVFDGAPPAWSAGTPCFRPRSATSGHPSTWPATNNVLLRRAAPDEYGVWFDERFRAGGSDTHFFRRLGRAGATFAWSDDAVVEELVPSSRARPRWAIQRSFRMANTAALCDRDIGERAGAGPARWLWWSSKSLAAGAARRDPVRLMRSATSAAWAAGLVAGSAGVRYREYRRG